MQDPRHSTRARIAAAVADVAGATAPSVLARHFVDALRRASSIASSAAAVGRGRADFSVAAAAAHAINATCNIAKALQPAPGWRIWRVPQACCAMRQAADSSRVHIDSAQSAGALVVRPPAESCSAIAAPTLAFCSSGVYHPASKMVAAALSAAPTPLDQHRVAMCGKFRSSKRCKLVAGILAVAVVAVSTTAVAGGFHRDFVVRENATVVPPPLCAVLSSPNSCGMEVYVARVQGNASYAVGDYATRVSVGADYAAVVAGLVGMPASCNSRVRALWCRASLPACDEANGCAPVMPCRSECFGVWAGCTTVAASEIDATVDRAIASIPSELKTALAVAHGAGGAAHLLALVRSTAACDTSVYGRDGECWPAAASPPAAALLFESNVCLVAH